MEKIKDIKWSNLPSSKIKEELIVLSNEHKSIKRQIDKLLNKLSDIEKEYHDGNVEIIKRYKGL
tara:strand:+ start:7256 stop:7447 length:192 start_codon:yes stop_codon:yes gene_type:complete